MVQNIEITAVTPLQNMDETTYWENRPFSGDWSESRCHKSTGIKRTIKKKPKRVRTAYTTEQLHSLELIYNQTKYITSDRRREIANALKIGDKSVKIWFQNRRMKEKRSSESDSSCEMTGDISPPPLFPTVRSSEPMAHQTEQNNFYASYQDQGYINGSTYEEPIQFQQITDLTANGMEFYNDGNVYPTQYYPANGDYSTGYYINYYQNQQDAYAWSTDYAYSSQFYS